MYLIFSPLSLPLFISECYLQKQFLFISIIWLFWRSYRIEIAEGDTGALTGPKKRFLKYELNWVYLHVFLVSLVRHLLSLDEKSFLKLQKV